jgi:hypothetical protein
MNSNDLVNRPEAAINSLEFERQVRELGRITVFGSRVSVSGLQPGTFGFLTFIRVLDVPHSCDGAASANLKCKVAGGEAKVRNKTFISRDYSLSAACCGAGHDLYNASPTFLRTSLVGPLTY